ncbi:HD domain-containing protein [Hugenholtzia roseola]|uniref:HD domain-containing protein n=1 Tax=Hugenholtzia roseola TaxID=1002 RepID=UPI000401023F|nr:HD domain-containing protein [Hugenholtzia roseola]
MSAHKIINDPVHGFISIPKDLIGTLIEHPYFQRLRRIKQLGLTEFVYPGALHTRFHHALGAMYLMQTALHTLREKGHDISAAEHKAALAAILLHDIGHTAFSHALENTLLTQTHHEELSLFLMQKLNEELKGRLSLAIDIFTDKYERHFFHQLVSSQLDMDRMDYLKRDCFFTGVSEGTIGSDRIIKMLDVHQDKIVVEAKGIYSIEHFLNARRLMYWQVYLHKTTVSTEQMLIQIFRRARVVGLENPEKPLFATPALAFFLKNTLTLQDFMQTPEALQHFINLDDYDVWGSIKAWTQNPDRVLSLLCKMLLERQLFKVKWGQEPIYGDFLESTREKTLLFLKKHKIDEQFLDYFFTQGSVSNAAYLPHKDSIWILKKDGRVVDITEASDLPHLKALSLVVRKHYLSYVRF